ncbi:uncharacterized protein H6S33_006552 [Morchella sextelata]|uniref:uncharacterized protein n=1 Tax=Morchella sextelata TaxID=1174677 RepID=UPI001D03B73F|nr:uncharacterized protein H6S33_006552 [Morchella sextelata]KAH0604884.1 hypothetical protein H6S33_006552 [Morchella sextelata]
MPPRPKSQKRPVPDGLNQRAPISASVSKRLRGAMSVSSAASSFNSINSIVSGSTTEADTDIGNGPPSLVESFSSYPEDQAVEEYSSRGWVGLDDHPEEDDAALEIYEDDYDYVDDYEDEYEPGDENLAPPNSPPPIPAPRPAPRPLSERRPSPPPLQRPPPPERIQSQAPPPLQRPPPPERIQSQAPPPLQRPPPPERIPSQAPPERRHFQAPPNQGSRLGKRVAEAPVASARALVASRKRSSRPVEEAIASSSVPVKITQVFAHYTLWYGNRHAVNPPKPTTQRDPRKASQAIERPSFTSPSSSIRSSSTLRPERELDSTPPASHSYRTPPATQYCGSPLVHETPGPESLGGSDCKLPDYKPIVKQAGELLGRYTLLEEPWPQPDSLVVNIRRFWAEANDYFNTSLNLTKSARGEVQIVCSRVRSHLVYAIKDYMARGLLYGMKELHTADSRATKVNYLLEKDRFISDPENYSTGRRHFWAPEIVDVIFLKYYKGDKMRGAKDPDFGDEGLHFNPSQNTDIMLMYSRMMDTWKKRSAQNQMGTLEVIRETIGEKIEELRGPKEVISKVGQKEDDEALAADIAAWRAAKARRKAQGVRATVENSDVDNNAVPLGLGERVEGLGGSPEPSGEGTDAQESVGELAEPSGGYGRGGEFS